MAKKKKHPSDNSLIASNRRARYEYEILETFEAGISLEGSEVKSLRDGGTTIAEAYAKIRGREVFLVDAYIPPFKQASIFNHEAKRPRKLLLHRREIKVLQNAMARKGLTTIPLRMYFNKRGLVKVQIGLGRGKKLHDKRQDLKKRDDRREISRYR